MLTPATPSSLLCLTHTSPAPVQGPNYRYEVTLRRVDGTPSTGFVYHCCWPCACDAEDLIKVDTLSVPTASGDVQMEFQVIGDP